MPAKGRTWCVSGDARRGAGPLAPAKGPALKRPNQSPGLMGLAIGFHLAACVFVGFAIGWLIDRRFAWETPWFTVVFVLLGSAAGLRHVIRMAERMGDDDNPYASSPDERPESAGPPEEGAAR